MPMEPIESKSIFKGHVIELSIEKIILPNGEPFSAEIIHHSGASAIVPIFDNGDVLLIKQYRYAGGGYIFEIPAGRLEKNEEPLLCAKRELLEETGYSANIWIPLISILTTPGFSDEVIHLFLAKDLFWENDANLESTECIEPVIVPFEKAIKMIEDGSIADSKTIAALYSAAIKTGLLKNTAEYIKSI